MLPFGTYPNANGSGEHLGFAVPGMIQETMDALMRLIGTPSNPGTFTQGPDYGSNADDMRTLLETFLGGNATRAGGEAALAARALSDTTPSLPGAVIAGAERNSLSDPTGFADAARRAQEMFPNNPIYNRVYRGVSPRERGHVGDLADEHSKLFASTSPEVASTYAPDWLDNGAVFPLDMSFKNPLVVDAKGSIWDQIPFEGKRWSSTDDIADIASQRGHDGLVIRNVIDNNMMGQAAIPGDTYVALKRGTVTSPLTGETLFSDNLPSLPGAVVAGAERNPTSAANHYNIHNPPRMPERPFEEDYPNGAQANDLGLLQFDMEGRPLQAQYVVGRNALGGPDRAFPSSQLDDLTEKLLGRSPQSVAPGDIPGIAAFGPGRTNQVGSAGNLYVDRTLPSPTRERALAHELGHALDHITNSETRVPPRVGAHGNETNLLNDEYGQIYHDLASPDDASRGEARAARDRISPANFGYPTDQHDAEYLAEAFRAYMTDPNYMKTVAPTAAARLRSYVNAHPDLSKIIQFNSDQLPSLWGSALQGQQNQPYPNSLFGY